MKVGLYIDAQNLWFGMLDFLKENHMSSDEFRLDYSFLISRLIHSNNRELSIGRAYIIHHPLHQSTSLESVLSNIGIDCRVKYLHKDRHKVDGNWNTEIVADVLAEIQQWDILCLMSSNKAFMPLIEQVAIKECKTVELVGFSQRLLWAKKIQPLFMDESSFVIKAINETDFRKVK